MALQHQQYAMTLEQGDEAHQGQKLRDLTCCRLGTCRPNLYYRVLKGEVSKG